MEIIQIREAVLALNKPLATELVTQAIEEGLDPVAILESGIVAGLQDIGAKFETGDYFLPELMIGGKISEACIDLITPHLPESAGAKLGIVVIGAVEGDLHDIGYSLVATQLELAGFEVHKLGVNVPIMTFIDKAREVKADIIGLSAFLVTTIPHCKEVIRYLLDMGVRDDFKVIIGGAETNQAKAVEIGADGWAPNAVEAVSLCRSLIGV
jgi:methanogenic corrinoid protein MtbC1